MQLATMCRSFFPGVGVMMVALLSIALLPIVVLLIPLAPFILFFTLTLLPLIFFGLACKYQR